jgi:hypothetical protein
VDRAKPFDIPKREVWEAYKKVRANQGTAGVDGESIADFEADLSNNLYKLWNRLSSGSYHPRRCEGLIPKGDGRGGTRPLGIPTVADRLAQTVVKGQLEPLVDPTLWRSSLPLDEAPILHLYGCLQPTFDVQKHPWAIPAPSLCPASVLLLPWGHPI